MQQQQHWQQTTTVNVPVQPANAPNFIGAVPIQDNVYPNFPRDRALGLGKTSIIAGALSIVCNIVALGVLKYDGFDFDDGGNILRHRSNGYGIWTGLLSIIAGSFGIAAGVHKITWQVWTFCVMCFVTTPCAIAQFALGVTAAKTFGPVVTCNSPDCAPYQVWFAMSVLLAILAVVEVVAAVWGFITCLTTCLSCTCCLQTSTPTVVANGVPVMGAQTITPMQVPGNNAASPPGYPAQPQPVQNMNGHHVYQNQGHY